MRSATRSVLALVALSAGLLTAVPAGASAVAAPKPTSPAARQAPYIVVAHKTLLKAAVKAKGLASFHATGVAGVPSTASAVVVSVTVPEPIVSGTLTFFGYGTKRPSTVSLAYSAGHTATSTLVLVPGTTGKSTVYNAAAKGDKVTVTVLGFYAAPGSTAAANAKTRFVSLPPKRVASVVLGTSPAAFATGVPATDVAGVVLSVTVPAPAKSGALALYAYGAKPAAATFAFTAHRPASTIFVAPVGSKGRVDVLSHSKAAVRVWVDVVGYLHALQAPSAPRTVSATAQNGGALITWTTPASDGGAPVAAYRLEVLPTGTTTVVPGEALQTSVGSLKNGTAYTFTVVAMNSVGSGPGTVSAPVTPYGVPAAPSNVTATATAVGTATVTWTAPTDTGGVPLTGYKVTASPGGAVTTSTTTSATVTGLTSGQLYTFTVAATNAQSTSLPSAASATVTGEGTSRVLPLGTTSGNDEDDSAISADGRYVAFDSDAKLTPDDTNNFSDVYVRDRLLGTTTLVSVQPKLDASGDSDSFWPSLSADGRYVAFYSSATNLVSPATTVQDVYVRDLVNHTTKLITTDYAHVGAEANGGSEYPAISGDGSTVAFASTATDLVPTSNGGNEQVYVETLATGAVRMASVATPSGAAGNGASDDASLSYNGQRVGFASDATNLTSLTTGAHEQIYVSDAGSGVTTMVSNASSTAGGDANSSSPKISSDGGFLAFSSAADNLSGGNGTTEVFVRNLSTGAIARASLTPGGADPNNSSNNPIVSAGGRYVVYTSIASNLVTGDTNGNYDVFRTDTTTGVTQLVSTTSGGVIGDASSQVVAATPDGLHVVFVSNADNLVSGDTNGYADVFVRDLG